MKNESGSPPSPPLPLPRLLPPILRESSHSPPKRKIDRARAAGLDNGRARISRRTRSFSSRDESCNTPLIFRSIASNFTRSRSESDEALCLFFFFFLFGSPRRKFHMHDRSTRSIANFFDRSISTTSANST